VRRIGRLIAAIASSGVGCRCGCGGRHALWLLRRQGRRARLCGAHGLLLLRNRLLLLLLLRLRLLRLCEGHGRKLRQRLACAVHLLRD
jgi:hypothetical protein